MSIFDFLFKPMPDPDHKKSNGEPKYKRETLPTKQIAVKYQGKQKRYRINQYGEVLESQD